MSRKTAAKRKPAAKSKSKSAAERLGATSRVIETKRREDTPRRFDPIGIPIFALHGGPYDGRDSKRDEEGVIDAIGLFPDRVCVRGSEGAAVYSITSPGDADFSHLGTE